MKAYPEDLRSKIVEAAERGMSTSGSACTFGVGISSVKRHAPDYESGSSRR
jgi:transposase